MVKNKVIKKVIIISLIIIFIIVIVFLINFIRYKNAKINIKYNNLNVEFLSNVKISDMIKSINGKIIKDREINTTKLGKQKITYKYINEDNLKLKQEFTINVVDKTPPLVIMKNSYTYKLGSEINFLNKIFCGDNYDSDLTKEIIGDYDANKIGKYDLVFKVTDKSGNETKKDFKLNIVDELPIYNYPNKTNNVINFADVIKEYKNENTEIGLDISKWQGDVDFQKIKESGVEFIFIRLGSSKGINKERFIDNKFERNITEANKVGIPVGLYFYSYANNEEEAIKDAKFVLKTLKGRKIDLPIVFDWENWQFYNEFSLSFYELSKMAQSFIKTVEKKGYKGMLYSSKNYLENVWINLGYPVWLAHYTKKTNYKGDYIYWQMCNNGRINGINGNVDIDIKLKR